MKALAAALLALAMVLGAIGGSYLLTQHYVNADEQNWCSIVDLVTRHPVPRPADPAANPSREQGWELYEDFLARKRQLHCG